MNNNCESWLVSVYFQVKYKENAKTELSSSLYSLLPETAETQFVRELTEILSEVRMDK